MSGSAAPAVEEPSSGEPRDDRTTQMPVLALDGFAGPLDRLLTLARVDRVDLARLSLPRLVDQLVAALGRAAPLERKGDWLVMASWLVQLRSDLLVPANPAQQRAAEAEAARLQRQLLALREVQALAAWLRRRPQLGYQVVNQRRCGTQRNSDFPTQCGADQRRNPLLTHSSAPLRHLRALARQLASAAR